MLTLVAADATITFCDLPLWIQFLEDDMIRFEKEGKYLKYYIKNDAMVNCMLNNLNTTISNDIFPDRHIMTTTPEFWD